MIKGDINNVISWIHNGGITEWWISETANGKQGNTVLFESDPNKPMEQELQRMIDRFAFSENSLLHLYGRSGQSKVGWQHETWSNMPESSKSPASVGGVSSMMTPQDIQVQIENAIERERLSWMRKDLERRESELRDEIRDFRKNQSSAIGMAMEKAGTLINTFIKSKTDGAHVAVAGTPEDKVNVVMQEAEEVKENDFTDEEAERLEAICRKFKDFDADYLTILEKLVNWAVSGENIEVMGMISMDYEKIKNLIMNNM